MQGGENGLIDIDVTLLVASLRPPGTAFSDHLFLIAF